MTDITKQLAFEAVELAEDAMAYVPEYFVNKHGMNRRMAALKEALAAHEAALRDLECPPDPEAVDRALAEPAGEAVPVAWPSAADIADEIDALLPMSLGDSTMAAIEEWWRQLVARKLSKLAEAPAVPEHVAHAARLLFAGNYRGPLFMAQTVIDWVHGLAAAPQAASPAGKESTHD